MAARTDYQIVGRYMSGREVTGYHLQSIESGKSGKYSRDAIAYLVGKEQISNCSGQIYKDKVILRGKGMSLDDLPTQNEDGTMKNTEHLGRVPKNATTADTMNMFMIVGVLRAGRNVVGYVIQNAGCGIKKVKRQQVIELAQQGKIGNARVQMYNGKPLLRGYGCNLDELPVENIGAPAETAAPNATEESAAPKASAPKKTMEDIARDRAKAMAERVERYIKSLSERGLKYTDLNVYVDGDLSTRFEFKVENGKNKYVYTYSGWVNIDANGKPREILRDIEFNQTNLVRTDIKVTAENFKNTFLSSIVSGLKEADKLMVGKTTSVETVWDGSKESIIAELKRINDEGVYSISNIKEESIGILFNVGPNSAGIRSDDKKHYLFVGDIDSSRYFEVDPDYSKPIERTLREAIMNNLRSLVNTEIPGKIQLIYHFGKWNIQRPYVDARIGDDIEVCVRFEAENSHGKYLVVRDGFEVSGKMYYKKDLTPLNYTFTITDKYNKNYSETLNGEIRSVNLASIFYETFIKMEQKIGRVNQHENMDEVDREAKNKAQEVLNLIREEIKKGGTSYLSIKITNVYGGKHTSNGITVYKVTVECEDNKNRAHTIEIEIDPYAVRLRAIRKADGFLVGDEYYGAGRMTPDKVVRRALINMATKIRLQV